MTILLSIFFLTSLSFQEGAESGEESRDADADSGSSKPRETTDGGGGADGGGAGESVNAEV